MIQISYSLLLVQTSTPTDPVDLWNSLEIAKLIVSALTPVAVLVGGWWINRRLKKLEHSQWANQKLIEKRIEVFDQVAPLLNDLLCYFTYIGCWKDLSPPEVVDLKRRTDRLFYVNSPLFSIKLRKLYEQFTGLCFSTFNTWGQDAQLRTHSTRRLQAIGNGWQSDWDSYFSSENAPELVEIRSAYVALSSRLAQELGVGDMTETPVSPVPVNDR